MRINHIKLLIITTFALSFFAILFFQTNAALHVKADGDIAADFKTKCAMCHSPKAEKNFDPTKSIEVLTQVILKGKVAKPLPMPAFETKGMTAEGAKAFAEYMLSLRKPADSNTNTPSNANANANTTANANANCVCPNPPANTNANTVPAKFSDETVATYKTKCAMCHSPKAEKNFDSTKADDVLLNTVLKGNPASKPPMPGYEAKGMKSEEATALIAYMKSLKQ